jgi:hypothetical protein
MSFWLRALLWLSLAAFALLAGFALFALALFAPGLWARGALPGDVQRQTLFSLYEVIALQALLPVLGLALASWLVLARVTPRLERSRGLLALGLTAAALVWFPPIGHFSFVAWTPTQPRDYFQTWALVSGGAALALFAPRALLRSLGPGTFSPRTDSGKVLG